MTLTTLSLHAGRACVLLALVALVVVLTRRAPASVRRLVAALGLGAVLLSLPVGLAVDALAISRARPVSIDLEPIAEPPGEAAVTPVVAHGPAAPVAAPLASPEIAPSAPATGWIPAALLAVWAAGALLSITRLVAAHVRAALLVRRARTTDDPRLLEAVREASGALQAHAALRLSTEVGSPLVLGLRAPTILLPEEALGWTRERLRWVLLHEIAHVRQGDALAQLGAALSCAIHWYNPLAWWLKSRFERERELAADELVLSSRDDAPGYASELLSMAAAARGLSLPGSGTIAMAASEIALRVEAVLRRRASRSLSTPVRVGSAVIALSLPVAVAACTGTASPLVAPEEETEGAATSTARSDTAHGPTGDALKDEVAAHLKADPDGFELTIDLRAQAIVDEEVAALRAAWNPRAATAIVVDPRTGRVLALHGADLARRAIAPGSTLKPFTIGAALQEGRLRADEQIDCGDGFREYGEKRMMDVAALGVQPLSQVLARSSNVGASRVFDALGADAFRSWLDRFHLVEPALELRGVERGLVPADIETHTLRGATAALGQGVELTPIAVAGAYGVIANGGRYNAPTLLRSAEPAQAPVLRPDVAKQLLAMLEESVTTADATGKAAAIEGVRVAGKTGTARLGPPGPTGTSNTYASFVGIVPADAPRFVVLVGAVDPQPEAGGGKVAAPAFAKIAARLLE